MSTVHLIFGNLIFGLGAFSVGFGIVQEDSTKINLGLLGVLIGVVILYSAISKKFDGKNRAFLISNSIYATLALAFVLLSFFVENSLTVRSMAAAILTVTAISLNIANFKDL